MPVSFQWIYYFVCNEFTEKETGKTHLCAVAGICRGSSLKVYQIRIHFSSVLLNSYLSLGGLMARTPAGDRGQTLPEETNFCIFRTLYFLQFQLCYAHIFFSFQNRRFLICISFSFWKKGKPSVLKLKLKVFIKFEKRVSFTYFSPIRLGCIVVGEVRVTICFIILSPLAFDWKLC